MLKNKLPASTLRISLAIVTVMLFLANLFFAHNILNISLDLTKVEQQLNAASNSVNELKVRLAISTSSSRIMQQAKELGFLANREVLYLENYQAKLTK